ncbi:hypothetical protein SFR_4316 [Streptomyces sp. FR-008]|nr:hypothetical protein SFR_4316 [Streptomyces sp. FR-008]
MLMVPGSPGRPGPPVAPVFPAPLAIVGRTPVFVDVSPSALTSAYPVRFRSP